MSLLLLYYRIFAIDRWTKIAIYFGSIVIGLFYLACILVVAALCIPRPGERWISVKYATRCERIGILGPILGIFGLVSDLYIYILPLPILFRLQMSLKKKLAIVPVFLTGLMYGLPHSEPMGQIIDLKLEIVLT